ncbi:MAG TPA: Ig-like domain-containing protein [Actinoplanes sp.]|nr:Ig-like domain-containing protein [Actinoplanes sp.]
MAAVAAGAVLLTGGCTSDEPSAGKPGASGSHRQDDARQLAAITTPASGSKGVSAATDIAFTTEHATGATVQVTDDKGATVAGAMLADGKTWRPDKALAYATTYTATVTVTGDDGRTGTAVSTFTTMPRPTNLVRVSSFLGDGQVVGVGMPMIVRFGQGVPQQYRADVQRRMTVTTTPPQVGIWHWVSPTEVRYRPQSYWQAGTKVSYKVQLAGVQMGDNAYGRSDLTVDLKIGRSFVMAVDNKTKRMTVRQDGKVVKTIPVSLGKKSTPSSSGTMVVIEKKRKTVFDTLEELGPDEGYRTKIDYAQRLTWGGEFIHAAPWSEGVQGRVNVSHGCVNVSMKMGAWLFSRTMIGDPITVKGTSRKLQNGNGWTDWNMSWDEYQKGSALPLGE